MMDGMIEAYVSRLAEIAPQRVDRKGSAAIIERLGGVIHQAGPDYWTLKFDAGSFVSANVEVEEKHGETSLRVSFQPRVAGGPIAGLTAEPSAWQVGPPMPDTGRIAISRNWFDLPSHLAISCSIIVADDGNSAAGDVICFVGSL